MTPILSQIGASDIASLLTQGAHGVAALAIAAAAYLFREMRALESKRLEETRADSTVQMDLLKAIIPLSQRLVDTASALERAVDRLHQVRT
jgi:hypothetical protein